MTCSENRYCATPVAFSPASYFAPAGAGIAKGLAPWLNRPTAVDVSPRLRRDRTVAKQRVSAPFAWSFQDLSTLTGSFDSKVAAESEKALHGACRSEEHTPELHSLMRNTSSHFCCTTK